MATHTHCSHIVVMMMITVGYRNSVIVLQPQRQIDVIYDKLVPIARDCYRRRGLSMSPSLGNGVVASPLRPRPLAGRGYRLPRCRPSSFRCLCLDSHGRLRHCGDSGQAPSSNLTLQQPPFMFRGGWQGGTVLAKANYNTMIDMSLSTVNKVIQN